MKLTQLQRYTAYCIMLEELKEGEFFCIMMDDLGLPMDESSIQEYFPELYADKPKRNFEGSMWFSYRNGNRKRISILKQCIYETHPDNPKNKRRHAK